MPKISEMARPLKIGPLLVKNAAALAAAVFHHRQVASALALAYISLI
ncbi:hypothetical protein [Alkalisalibacterium limincola]|nr:hypothetical protein [Alkalisalibacterium limincola]